MRDELYVEPLEPWQASKKPRLAQWNSRTDDCLYDQTPPEDVKLEYDEDGYIIEPSECKSELQYQDNMWASTLISCGKDPEVPTSLFVDSD